MKALILTIALALTATLGMAQFPQSKADDSCCYVSENIRAAIIDNDDSTVDVKIAKLPNELVKIRVYDNGNIIHQTRVKKHEIVDLSFDLKNYPKGEYKFEIIEGSEVVLSKNITYSDNNQYLVKK